MWDIDSECCSRAKTLSCFILCVRHHVVRSKIQSLSLTFTFMTLELGQENTVIRRKAAVASQSHFLFSFHFTSMNQANFQGKLLPDSAEQPSES